MASNRKAYGKAMQSAHESLYGKVPTAKPMKLPKMSMPSMGMSMTTPAVRTNRNTLRSAASRALKAKYR